MNKKLLAFYGEVRNFAEIYKLYKESGRLDGYDVVIATWDTTGVDKVDISHYDSTIRWVINPITPTYHNLKSNENCIVYHCKNIMDVFDTSQYEHIVFQRTDFNIELQNIQFKEVRKHSIYRVFNNCNFNYVFMNDIVIVGKPDTFKKHWDAEYDYLFTRKQGTITGPLNRNLLEEQGFNHDDFWKPLGQWSIEEAQAEGINPSHSQASDVICENIANLLDEATKRNYINQHPPAKTWESMGLGTNKWGDPMLKEAGKDVT
jgi:hypothetical protein